MEVLPGQSWNSWYWKGMHVLRCNWPIFLLLALAVFLVIWYVVKQQNKKKRKRSESGQPRPSVELLDQS